MKENRFISWVLNHWIQILLFCVAIGNADVWRDYLITTGAKDSYQLIIAIYATEMVIVSASLWGGYGIIIATAMFASSLVAIHSTYGDGTWLGGDWIGHSYFSITIWLGTLGEWARHKVPQIQNERALGLSGKAPEALKLSVDDKGQLNTKELSLLSVAKLRRQFNLSEYGGQKIQKMARKGEIITVDLIRKYQKAA